MSKATVKEGICLFIYQGTPTDDEIVENIVKWAYSDEGL
jgi:hypothetical protein